MIGRLNVIIKGESVGVEGVFITGLWMDIMRR